MTHEYRWTLVVHTSRRLSAAQRALIESGTLDPLVAGLRAAVPLVVDAEAAFADHREVA